MLGGSATKHIGRLPGLYVYNVVVHDGKEYAVITIQHKHNDVRFVIDNCNVTEVLTKPWHISSGKYIATHYTLPDGKMKEIHLHNFIKDHCMTDARDKVVVHINNNMLDNRSENLRVLDPSEYFPSRQNRKRTTTLPPDSGVVVDDIPKYISFIKSSGEHGDRFAIEIPRLNVFMKLSSSKRTSLKDKLEEAKRTLHEIYETYPHVNPHIDDALKFELNTSLEQILHSSSVVTV
jgi:hypothetical protein